MEEVVIIPKQAFASKVAGERGESCAFDPVNGKLLAGSRIGKKRRAIMVNARSPCAKRWETKKEPLEAAQEFQQGGVERPREERASIQELDAWMMRPNA